MRAIGRDTYAMSNPALASVLLWQFAKSYEKENKAGPPLSLCFIVLPIVMSRIMVETFAGTNVRTGFLTWLARHPELTLQLAGRVDDTKELTAEALRFGIAYRIFTISDDGSLAADSQAISLSKQKPGFDERVTMLRVASHLGNWMSNLPEATVFYSLGITP